jgi:putative ABC transport system permease protein
MLLKHPGFTAIAVIALALGIGANTAIFSVVNAVLLRPLPFAEPDSLMVVYESRIDRGGSRSSVSYPNFADWRAQNTVFEHMSTYRDSDFVLTGDGEPVRLHTAVVNADLLPLLSATPIIGRSFLSEEDKPGDAGRVVLLSHRLWQQRFSGDQNVLGKSLVLNGKNYQVVGVMPDGFQFPVDVETVDLWTTVAVDSGMFEQRGAHYMHVIARLKPGITQTQATAEMEGIAANLERQYPDENSHRGVTIVPALESLVGDVRPALLILLGAVGMVLLIACVNVANLLLARATTRHREMAIRAALGASRFRVVRQLLTESVLLAMAGGALGLLVALWGTDVLVSLSRDDLPRAGQIGLDVRVLGFTLLVSLLTGIVFGIVPAIQSSRTDLTESLKEGGRGSTEGGRNRLRAALVIGEVAIAIVLLAGAGLLIQSLRRLEQVNPGFNPHNLLTFSLGLPEVRYKPEQQIQFYQQLKARLESLPGVKSASAVMPLPLGGDRMRVTFETEGRPIAKGELPATEIRTIGLDYFKTMGIPLIKGRDFTDRDVQKAPAVIIVNEAFAKQFFPGEEVIGKHIKPGISDDDDDETAMREIVGLVGNVKHQKLNAEADPEAYEPHAQLTFDMTMLVKTETDPHSIVRAAQNEVKALDKDLPAYGVKSLDEYMSASVARPRFNALLLGIFASLALILTAVGLYGVMNYSVTQRTHEIGIRVALGARQQDVLKMVVRQGMMLTGIGIGTGLIGAYFLTRLLETMLFGVGATDPLTFIAISIVLAGVALGACFVPARRATKVDPMIALRYE